MLESGHGAGVCLVVEQATDVYITIHQLDLRLRVSDDEATYADLGFEIFDVASCTLVAHCVVRLFIRLSVLLFRWPGRRKTGGK